MFYLDYHRLHIRSTTFLHYFSELLIAFSDIGFTKEYVSKICTYTINECHF